jgi:hypothetical protein
MNGAASGGAVYVQTNAAPNEVIAFRRAADGSLDRISSVATGGDGDGSPHLQSQGSVALTREGRHRSRRHAGAPRRGPLWRWALPLCDRRRRRPHLRLVGRLRGFARAGWVVGGRAGDGGRARGELRLERDATRAALHGHLQDAGSLEHVSRSGLTELRIHDSVKPHPQRDGGWPMRRPEYRKPTARWWGYP